MKMSVEQMYVYEWEKHMIKVAEAAASWPVTASSNDNKTQHWQINTFLKAN